MYKRQLPDGARARFVAARAQFDSLIELNEDGGGHLFAWRWLPVLHSTAHSTASGGAGSEADFHVFVSPHNVGADELLQEARAATTRVRCCAMLTELRVCSDGVHAFDGQPISHARHSCTAAAVPPALTNTRPRRRGERAAAVPPALTNTPPRRRGERR